MTFVVGQKHGRVFSDFAVLCPLCVGFLFFFFNYRSFRGIIGGKGGLLLLRGANCFSVLN